MASGNQCGECGAAIPADSPGGFCGQCLLSLGLKAAEPSSEITGARPAVGEQSCSQPSSPAKPGQPANHLTAFVAEKLGDRIGRYRLIEEIGRGGCGVVFLAEQEEPVHRKVALKVIKLGMDTRQVVARFEAERQALALMDHPNIAKVLDAGATAGGRPYFVMELVNGIRITDYCDQHRLTTRGRLDLFVQVCHAIQHAHQKGIIHRDVKPSNVLVITHDGVATPKVIDFGIAKATQGRLTDQTFFTAFEQFLGTPAYMSPEQAVVGGLDIDTRSDIYSLGVLLYEMLTGQTPFDAKQLLGAGLEAMRRTIRETEPVTPSTRVAQQIERVRGTNSLQLPSRQTTESQGAAPSTAPPPPAPRKQRRELILQLRGDLDWIVMKCLEKDRARRYETANGLARDIERHLHHEPVVAGPPSNLYRFQKFVRRNKGATLSVIAIATVLLLGVTVSTWQAVRATEAERQQKELRQQAERAQTNEAHARLKAQTEAAKSQQVASFLSDMLRGVGPSKARGRDTTMLKEILDKTSERVGRDLTNQPEVQLEIRQTLANTYHELGLYREMEQIARQMLPIAQSLPGGDNLHIPAALEQIGDARQHLGDFEQAEQFTREALALFRLQLGEEHHRVAYSLNDLAVILQGQEKLPEAEAIAREAVRINRKVYGDEHPETTTTLGNLADILRDQGKLAEAETIGREILALRRTILGPDSPSYLVSLINLGGVLQRQGKPVEAEAMEREALASAEKVLGEHPNVATCLATLANCLKDQGKLPEAEQMARRALTLQQKLFGDDHPKVASNLRIVASVLQAQKRLPEAEETYRAALLILRKQPGQRSRATVAAAGELAGVLEAQSKWAEAETIYREALELERKLYADDPSKRPNSFKNLARALEAQEKWAQAEPLLREELEIERKRRGPMHRDVAVESHHLAQILGQENKLPEAESLLRRALSVFRTEAAKEPPQEISNLAIVLHHLAEVLRKQKALPQARELAEEALALYRLHPELSVTEKQHAVQIQARVEADLGNTAPAEAVLKEQLESLRTRVPIDEAELSSTLSQLTHLLLDKGKFADAEPLARECWTLRKANFPNDWRTFSSAAVLGRCLLGLKRHTEAEPLLLSGYEGMKQREANIPSRNRVRLEDAARNLVQVYDATGRPDQGAQWKQRLEEYEQSQASPSPR